MNQKTDSYGSPTSATAEAMPGINDFVEGFISYQPRATNVLATADAQPGSALANLHAACLWMFLERPEAPGKAEPYILRAEAVAGQHPRERALGELVRAWQRYDSRAVVAIAEGMLDEWPQDLATLKLAQYHLFNAGDSPGMLRFAEKVATTNQAHAPFHSMLAFGHEQCHHIDAAERAAGAALAIDEREPWAHHAMAHVHLTRGTIEPGRRFLQDMAPAWQDLNSFMFTHNWWHLALFEISSGEVDIALGIYDERCRDVQPDYSQDQIGAISLLARLECAGVDVGDRWQALASLLETRSNDVVQPFLTLQYLYGLARCLPSAADDLMQLVRQQAVEPVVAGDRELWISVGIPAAEGVLAHARGEFRPAAERLSEVRSRLWQIGGSHAQRDLFDQLLLDARLKSGQWTAARQMLEGRRRYEPDSPLLHARLAQLSDKPGLQ